MHFGLSMVFYITNKTTQRSQKLFLINTKLYHNLTKQIKHNINLKEVQSLLIYNSQSESDTSENKPIIFCFTINFCLEFAIFFNDAATDLPNKTSSSSVFDTNTFDAV